MEPVSETPSIELSRQLEDGHDFAPMPPVVDGVPVIPPQRPLVVLKDEDWICLKGPCRHYWRLEHAIDAEAPKEVVEKDGRKVVQRAATYANGDPVTVPVAIAHFCIPMAGIEMPMRDELVMDCNRWDPIDPDSEEVKARDKRRHAFAMRLAKEEAKAKASAPANFARATDLASAQGVMRELAARLEQGIAHRDSSHAAKGVGREGDSKKLLVQCSCSRNWIVTDAQMRELMRAAPDSAKAVFHAAILIEKARLEAEGK